MVEVGIGIVIVFGLFLIQGFLNQLPWSALLDLGLNMTLICGVLGMALAIYYHARLLGGVKARGHSIERWWVDPRPLHRHFPAPQQKSLNSIFWVGVALFTFTVAGSILAAYAVWRGLN